MPTDPHAALLTRLDTDLVCALQRILEEELDARRIELQALGTEVHDLVSHLQTFLQGGKLLRPRFCLLGGLAALPTAPSAEQLAVLARIGAAIEMVQAAALIHDDVIDHSPMRRGRPAVHVAAEEAHRHAGLIGDSADYGVATAIVLGDLALSWSEQMAAQLEQTASLDIGSASRARDEFDLLRTEVMSGQYLDILHQAGGLSSAADPEEAALRVIRWKTVPYTVDRPVRIGAALMGADTDLLDELTRWAIDVGTAFQLRDDLLSIVGDEAATGKPVGGDIREGKRTVLLARTEAAADASGMALLRATVGRADASQEQVQSVCDLMRTTGAVNSVATDVRTRAERAQALLEESQLLSPLGAAGLGQLAAVATDLTPLNL